MKNAISAAEANRQFSAVLRMVTRGASVVVTSHGKPVAQIIPYDDKAQTKARARTALFARLKKEPAMNVGRWTRDELYDPS